VHAGLVGADLPEFVQVAQEAVGIDAGHGGFLRQGVMLRRKNTSGKPGVKGPARRGAF
jgi:hypothetical protein